MKVLNLQCSKGHGFEGWFASEDDYARQSEGGLVECPLCADKSVRKLPSAPRLNLGATPAAGSRRADAPTAAVPAAAPAAGPREMAVSTGPATTPEQQSVEALWMQAVRHVMSHTQDVGHRFAEEARRMHYGEAEHRGIRGQTTPDEAQALKDEGIEFHNLPIPKGLEGPAH